MEASLELVEFRYLGTLLLLLTVISLVILINQIYHSYIADKYDKLNKKTINSVITDRSVSSIMNTCVNKAINNYYSITKNLIVDPTEYSDVAKDAVSIFYDLASTSIIESVKDYTNNERSYLQALAESIVLSKYNAIANNSEEFLHFINS